MKRSLSDRERLILVALALALVTATVIWATVVFIPERHVNGMLQGHWLRFGIVTLFLCAFLLRAYWKARKSLGFWIIFSGFLAVHCLGLGHLWAIYNGFSTLEFVLLGCGEWVLIALLLYWVTGVEPSLRPWRSRSRWVPTL